MSVCFVIAPAVIAAWPAFASCASAAATALGFKFLKEETKASEKISAAEVELEESEFLADKLKDTDSIDLIKEDVKISFYINKKKKFAMHISSENKTEEELKEIGKELYNKIKQQYAYLKVTTELKKKGYNIVEEEKTVDGSIRIKLVKY